MPGKWKTRLVATECKTDEPTEDEVKSHVQNIHNLYGNSIYGWFCKLVAIDVPAFEGEEPTVKEFFSENYDTSNMKVRSILLSYAAIKE